VGTKNDLIDRAEVGPIPDTGTKKKAARRGTGVAALSQHMYALPVLVERGRKSGSTLKPAHARVVPQSKRAAGESSPCQDATGSSGDGGTGPAASNKLTPGSFVPYGLIPIFCKATNLAAPASPLSGEVSQAAVPATSFL
jgi:hypothetical protein